MEERWEGIDDDDKMIMMIIDDDDDGSDSGMGWSNASCGNRSVSFSVRVSIAFRAGSKRSFPLVSYSVAFADFSCTFLSVS